MQMLRGLILGLGLSAAFVASAQVGNHPSLLDPNTASASELLGLPGSSQAVVDAIDAARPVLNMLDLDRALAPQLSREQLTALYGQVFRQINLNSASREEIMLIPGMSARMAHEFEEYRPYTSLDQFRREMGKYVDAAEVARLEQYVFVPMNLNTATGADFLTIPGMNNRMVHEFEEYRPYTSMDQFRREIGKYVDADEVARLESYVTID
jgi:DNA uptake protein ComE-like DNA-binding protein